MKRSFSITHFLNNIKEGANIVFAREVEERGRVVAIRKRSHQASSRKKQGIRNRSALDLRREF